ncbi:MAG: 2-hydroxychromene-2-carboxylate isomerase [Sphingomonadales bacterium]
MTQPLYFWFEFASTYSYVTAMRIEAEAEKYGVHVIWKPFLLGPIFAKQGWNTSPFNIYEAKGRYMWRDLARLCAKHQLPLHPSVLTGIKPFPQNGLLAARVALAALQQDWGEAFCRQVFAAQFAHGLDIAEPDVVAKCIEEVGGDAEAYMAAAKEEEWKQTLRRRVEEAQHLGIFGAPSLVVGEELFWGDDRLQDALDWACS